MESKLERYIGTLLGCAVGDALGMPVEGWNRDQIKKYVGRITKPIDPVILKDSSGNLIEKDEFGELKSFTKDLSIGDGTDDTVLTFALGESILEKKGLDIYDIAKRQLAAYEATLKPDGTSSAGFGTTTIEGFKNLQKGLSPLESGIIGGPGNAPAMKISPVGIYMDVTGKYNEGLHYAELIAKITHLDPRSVALGPVHAHVIYSLLQGVSRDELINSAFDVCLKNEKQVTGEFMCHEMGSLASRLQWIKENKDTDTETAFKNIRNSSLGFESYPFTLFMFQKYWDDPIEGMIETVNHGGDCDTTGAIYGTMCGAKNGLIFPSEWTGVSKYFARAFGLGRGLYNLKT